MTVQISLKSAEFFILCISLGMPEIIRILKTFNYDLISIHLAHGAREIKDPSLEGRVSSVVTYDSI